MWGSVGFVVDGQVMFGVVVGQIAAAFVLVVQNCSWDSRHRSHHKRRSMALVFRGTMVWLVMPTSVELFVWIGVRGCGQPISLRVCWRGTISLAVV